MTENSNQTERLQEMTLTIGERAKLCSNTLYTDTTGSVVQDIQWSTKQLQTAAGFFGLALTDPRTGLQKTRMQLGREIAKATAKSKRKSQLVEWSRQQSSLQTSLVATDDTIFLRQAVADFMRHCLKETVSANQLPNNLDTDATVNTYIETFISTYMNESNTVKSRGLLNTPLVCLRTISFDHLVQNFRNIVEAKKITIFKSPSMASSKILPNKNLLGYIHKSQMKTVYRLFTTAKSDLITNKINGDYCNHSRHIFVSIERETKRNQDTKFHHLLKILVPLEVNNYILTGVLFKKQHIFKACTYSHKKSKWRIFLVNKNKMEFEDVNTFANVLTEKSEYIRCLCYTKRNTHALFNRSAEPRKDGLKNIGNTCYANAVFQSIVRLPALTTMVCTRTGSASSASSPHRVVDFVQLIGEKVRQSTTRTNESLLRSFLKQVLPKIPPRLAFGKQHDAQEFLELVIRSFQQENCASFGTERNAFQGFLSYEFTCSACQKSHSSPVEMFISLPLDMRPTLRESIKTFCEPDTIASKVCTNPQCLVEGSSTKAVRVRQWPPVLVFQLKRFTTTPGHGSTTQVKKNMEDMSILSKLETTRELSQCSKLQGYKIVYNIHSIILHQGDSISSGHYIAYVRSADSQTGWFRYDDEFVQEISSENIFINFKSTKDFQQKFRPYILIYNQTSYFEKQRRMQCGQHSINNLLQYHAVQHGAFTDPIREAGTNVLNLLRLCRDMTFRLQKTSEEEQARIVSAMSQKKLTPSMRRMFFNCNVEKGLYGIDLISNALKALGHRIQRTMNQASTWAQRTKTFFETFETSALKSQTVGFLLHIFRQTGSSGKFEGYHYVAIRSVVGTSRFELLDSLQPYSNVQSSTSVSDLVSSFIKRCEAKSQRIYTIVHVLHKGASFPSMKDSPITIE